MHLTEAQLRRILQDIHLEFSLNKVAKPDNSEGIKRFIEFHNKHSHSFTAEAKEDMAKLLGNLMLDGLSPEKAGSGHDWLTNKIKSVAFLIMTLPYETDKEKKAFGRLYADTQKICSELGQSVTHILPFIFALSVVDKVVKGAAKEAMFAVMQAQAGKKEAGSDHYANMEIYYTAYSDAVIAKDGSENLLPYLEADKNYQSYLEAQKPSGKFYCADIIPAMRRSEHYDVIYFILSKAPPGLVEQLKLSDQYDALVDECRNKKTDPRKVSAAKSRILHHLKLGLPSEDYVGTVSWLESLPITHVKSAIANLNSELPELCKACGTNGEFIIKPFYDKLVTEGQSKSATILLGHNPQLKKAAGLEKDEALSNEWVQKLAQDEAYHLKTLSAFIVGEWTAAYEADKSDRAGSAVRA